MLPDKLYKKIRQHIATGNDDFFQKQTHLIWIVQWISNANHVPCCVRKKTQFHRNINISSLFRWKYTKCPFLDSSKLDHAICPDLFLVIVAREVWKDHFHFAERSLAACNTYCHRQRILQSNLKNVRRTSGRDNFKLHGLILAFRSLEYSRTISYYLHMNCKQLLNCDT